MTDRPTNQPTNGHEGITKVTLPLRIGFGSWRLEVQQVNKVLIGPYIILLEPWLALQWTINSETVSASASILIDPVISSFCKKKLTKSYEC